MSKSGSVFVVNVRYPATARSMHRLAAMVTETRVVNLHAVRVDWRKSKNMAHYMRVRVSNVRVLEHARCFAVCMLEYVVHVWCA